MYDAIVIGARCAGSPTAMLLARHGHRVLLVDRAAFPSDTMSTHLIHPHGVAALRRWGVLDDLIASGVPALSTLRLDFELNAQFAALEPLTPELQSLVAALATNQLATDRFIGVISGAVPVAEFFSPPNLARITGTSPQEHALATEAGVR